MKFVSAKKPVQYANRLEEIREQSANLRKELRALKEEHDAIQSFLNRSSKQQNFQFNGKDGYLYVLEWISRSKEIIDNDAVELIFRKLKKPLPTRIVEWTQAKIRTATEEDV